MVLPVPLFRLQCGVNSYDWGKLGKESKAATLASATPADGFTIQEDKPYAELWMGTHPSNPSRDVQTGRTLLDIVESNATLLGDTARAKYGAKLPFLFKVLSINKALSIQAHPNKKRAAELHAKDPKNYPDDNHKPEMAIAITPFEGLCGFRPLGEIAGFLDSVPALRGLVGEDVSRDFITHVREYKDPTDADDQKNRDALKTAFAALMKSTPEDIASATKTLLADAESKGAEFANGGNESTTGAVMAELVTRSNKQFPDDIGLFVLFFLNYVQLTPGEALFLRADDIHAYLSGDIMECMAASDNVVRAGFTPKFKDVDTLVDLLTYNFAPIDQQKMEKTHYAIAKTVGFDSYNSGSEVDFYNPNEIDEFVVGKAELKKKGAKAVFDPIDGPSIVICTSGKGTISVGEKTEQVSEGLVFFVGADTEYTLVSETEDFLSFSAFFSLLLKDKESNHGTNGATNGSNGNTHHL